MMPYTNNLFNFLHLCLTDQDRTEAVIRPAIGLLGDLADAFGAQLKAPLSQEWVGDSFRVARARTYPSAELKKVVRWSKEVRSQPGFIPVVLSRRRSDGPPRDCVVFGLLALLDSAFFVLDSYFGLPREFAHLAK